MFLILIMLLSLMLDTTFSFPLTLNYNVSNCTNSSNNPLYNSYETNLNQLLTNIVSQISTTKHGFLTQKQTQDNQVPLYGLAFCRGDLNSTECQACINLASNQIKSFCPRAIQAILWKEQCMLRYSNESFFSVLEEQPYQLQYNPIYVTQDIDGWYDIVHGLLDEVTSAAASNESGYLYATKEGWYPPVNNYVSTMAQCTPDLTTANCAACFKTARSIMFGTLHRGAAISLPSCTIRFEVNRFYQFSSSSISQSNTSRKNRGKKKWKVMVAVVVPLAVLLGMLIMGTRHLIKKKRKKNLVDIKKVLSDLTIVESLVFDLEVLESATNHFSNDQILGQGGFGSVYKGTLANGQDIAVKRLANITSQVVEEFKNEVVLIANLQHRNLVKLLGFCLAVVEKLLVYEFVPNKSLNYFLFDTKKQGELLWSTRYNIIRGIARGLLYLHEDSQPRIIHRDLKSGNILLDANMNPKIADFGLARMFNDELTVENTNRVIGTFGYMAPEYAMHGHFSVKSDVYSFGVVVLEIVSGKKITKDFCPSGAGDLLTYAWRNLIDERPLEFMDPTLLNDSYSSVEVLKCIHLGLWCAQENSNERPTMSIVVQTLNSESSTTAMPIPPYPRTFYNCPYLTKTSTTTGDSKPTSENQVTISVMHPR